MKEKYIQFCPPTKNIEMKFKLGALEYTSRHEWNYFKTKRDVFVNILHYIMLSETWNEEQAIFLIKCLEGIEYFFLFTKNDVMMCLLRFCLINHKGEIEYLTYFVFPVIIQLFVEYLWVGLAQNFLVNCLVNFHFPNVFGNNVSLP